MNDIAMTALGTGVAMGALSGYASKSGGVGLVAATVGVAAGGLAAYVAERGDRHDGDARGLLHPLNASGALSGAALGALVTGAIQKSVAFEQGALLSGGQKAAMFGVFMIAGAAIFASLGGAVRFDN